MLAPAKSCKKTTPKVIQARVQRLEDCDGRRLAELVEGRPPLHQAESVAAIATKRQNSIWAKHPWRIRKIIAVWLLPPLSIVTRIPPRIACTITPQNAAKPSQRTSGGRAPSGDRFVCIKSIPANTKAEDQSPIWAIHGRGAPATEARNESTPEIKNAPGTAQRFPQIQAQSIPIKHPVSSAKSRCPCSRRWNKFDHHPSGLSELALKGQSAKAIPAPLVVTRLPIKIRINAARTVAFAKRFSQTFDWFMVPNCPIRALAYLPPLNCRISFIQFS